MIDGIRSPLYNLKMQVTHLFGDYYDTIDVLSKRAFWVSTGLKQTGKTQILYICPEISRSGQYSSLRRQVASSSHATYFFIGRLSLL